jgi:DNA polymerase-3 subunit epsilon
MYAIIDIETTGGKFHQEHIMEIAVFVFDGKKVVDQFITLVNPEAKIQPYVSKITGISEKMLRRAPKFYEIAKRIVKLTEDCVFVAHNVKFDYRVVQLEFERLGFEYHRKTLDTITLAEKLIPGLKSYGLETVCDELGISNTHRHRADGDARATVELFKLLLEKDSDKLISKLATSVEESENQNPFKDLVRPLKNATGVYYIYNAQGKVVYVGMGSDMKNSIERHFLATNQQARKLQQAASSLNVEETGNEAIARMKAFAELRKLHPAFNKQVYTKFLPIGLFAERDGSKATFLRVGPVKKKKAVAYFKDQNEAHDFLLQVLVKYKADADVLLMEKDAKALAPFLKKYSYKPERKDIPLAAIKREVLPNANFMALGPGRHPNEKSLIWVENHTVKGYAWYELDSFLEDEEVIKKHLTVLTPHPYLNSLLKHYLELGNLKTKTGAN